MDKKRVTFAVIVVVVIVVLGVLWKKDKLNKYLPEKLRHKPITTSSNFVGLMRNQQYTMGPGGSAGMPGIDLNSSDWV